MPFQNQGCQRHAAEGPIPEKHPMMIPETVPPAGPRDSAVEDETTALPTRSDMSETLTRYAGE